MSFINHFEPELAMLSEPIKAIIEPQFRQYCEQFDASNFSFPECPEFIPSVIKVWGCSPYVAQQCIRNPEMLIDLLATGDLFSAYKPSFYRDSLLALPVTSEVDLMKRVRQLRHREMVRIAWRDLAGWVELEETMIELTWLGEACVSHALDYLYQQACDQYGTPLMADGSAQQLVVLGMGKLGAWELNYSSDIDLILAFAEDGMLTDRKQTSYAEFFTKLAQRLVKFIGEKTVDGFVFRVDARLRPFGESGPLVMSFGGMENYYLTQAREWERYAMIKARQVAGDFQAGELLFVMLNQFIYRRYLDYGAFEELRSMKYKISESLKRKDRQDNIKLGAGGIREVEFIGQAFQLIRGGRHAELQQQEILKVLDALVALKQMAVEEVTRLKECYRFLRLVENRLQQYQDQQTHDIPVDELQQQILAYGMGYDNWLSFKVELDQVRLQVQQVFEQVFTLSGDVPSDGRGLSVWVGESDPNVILEELEGLGYPSPEKIQHLISGFRSSTTIRRLSRKGAETLDQLMPQLIGQVGKISNSEQTLIRLLALLEKVAGRNVYLALLAENDEALSQLIQLSSASHWICEYLGGHPVLFDELLDARALYEPLSREGLSEQLALLLKPIDEQDVEQVMVVLREFKHVHVLKIAAADIMGVFPLMVVSDYLTCIAEVLLEQVVQWVWHLMVSKYGSPQSAGEQNKGFGIIGMGKLGGHELGYGSDLDMVFLHDCEDANAMTDGPKPIDCVQFYGRMGQRIMTIFNTQMLAGILYEVDMRLRPNGKSGLLVCNTNAYRDYLQTQAWTWEHQALVRGRFIAGDVVVKQKFEQIREQILRLPRDHDALKTEVREMREKMRTNLDATKSGQFNLKQSIGGIADIEFIVQFNVLANAKQYQQLIEFTDNIRILKALKKCDLITKQDAQDLTQAYCDYRDRGHHQTLQDGQVIIDAEEFSQLRAKVKAIWQKIMN